MSILRTLVLLETTLGLLVQAAVLRGNNVFQWLSSEEPSTSDGNVSERMRVMHEGVDVVHFAAGVPKIKVHKARAYKAKERTHAGGPLRIGGGTNQSSGEIANRVILDVKCGEPFAGPDENAFCPEACPYMRFDPDRMCHFKCITKEWCLTAPNMPSSFPDDASGKCVACQVSGCKKCINPYQCEDGGCHEGFDMVRGDCRSKSRTFWRSLALILGGLVTVIGIYLARVKSRAITQSMRLKQAKLFRSYSKLRQASDGHNFYALSTNLCRDLVCGVGVLLHFRFQAFWLLWALVVVICSASLSFHLNRFKASDIMAMTPTHEEVFRQCKDFGNSGAVQVYVIQESFIWLAGILYVLTTLACFAFAIVQRQVYQKEDDVTASMEDYALLASHMPIEKADGGNLDNLEETYLSFFQDVYGEGVIGVSICWNFGEYEGDIVDATAGQLRGYDKTFDHRFLTGDELKKLDEEEQNSVHCQSKIDLEGEANIEKEDIRNCKVPEMRCLDYIMCGTTPDVDYKDSAEENAQIASLVRKLDTTGFVFIILNSEQAQQTVLELTLQRKADGNPVRYPGSDKDIKMSREEWEPATVLWSGFAVPKRDRMKNIRNGILITLLVIGVWGLCFYGPYIGYVLSWSSVAGASQGNAMSMSLLGAMCAIGNQIVYFTCAKVADNAGFRTKDKAMAFNCCLYTFAVLINITVDVSLFVVAAHGFQRDSGMDPTAAIRNPSFQYSLYLQLVGYLYPMTLLVPYLAEPIPMNIIPYFLGKWMIRSAARISRFNAEQALVCPEFDLLRYGDIIINVSTVIVCLFLATVSLWWIFLWLFVSNMVIYAWDHVRLLRYCEETYFANNFMETCSQYISGLPCALLAAAFVFKYQNGEEVLKSWDIDVQHGMSGFATSWRDVNKSLWLSVAAGFVGHLVFHTLVISFVVPRFVPEKGDPREETYAEVAALFPYTWFNSNPVHCLRSQSLGWDDHDPPYIFYQRGKEYVHKKNAAIHQYYEGKTEYVAEMAFKDVSESMRRRTSSGLKKAHEGLHRFLHRRPNTSKIQAQTPKEGTEHLDEESACAVS